MALSALRYGIKMIIRSPDTTQASNVSRPQDAESNLNRTGFPHELFMEVLQYLLPKDIGQVALTCRALAEICRDDYLWRKLSIIRFGKNALPSLNSAISCRKVYEEMSSLRVLAPALNINWLNQHYWALESLPDLVSPKAAILYSVCWIHVTGSLYAVPRGRYKVRWRIRFHRRAYGLEKIMFVAETQAQHLDTQDSSSLTVSCTLGSPYLNKFAGIGWIYYEMPDVLDVGAQSPYEFRDVDMKIVDHSGSWKSGLILDFVELVRV